MTLLRLWPVGVAVLAIVAGQWAYIASLRGVNETLRADLTNARASVQQMGRLLDAETSNCDPAADREWLRAFGNELGAAGILRQATTPKRSARGALGHGRHGRAAKHRTQCHSPDSGFLRLVILTQSKRTTGAASATDQFPMPER